MVWTFAVRFTPFIHSDFDTASLHVSNVSVGADTNHGTPRYSIDHLALGKTAARSHDCTRILTLSVHASKPTWAVGVRLAARIFNWFTLYFGIAGKTRRTRAQVPMITIFANCLHSTLFQKTWSLAFVVATSSCVRTIIISVTFYCFAETEWITFVTLDASALLPVVGHCTLCICTAWVDDKTQIDALIVSARFIIWTFIIGTADNFLAFNAWISKKSWWTAADGSMNGHCADGFLGTRVLVQAWIFAIALQASQAAITFTIVLASLWLRWRSGNWYASSVGIAHVTFGADADHSSPRNCVDYFAFSQIATWPQGKARILAGAINTSVATWTVSIRYTIIVNINSPTRQLFTHKSWWTVAYSFVILSFTSHVTTGARCYYARIFALVVKAHSVIGTFRVRPAFNIFALLEWVSLEAANTLACLLLVDHFALGVDAAWVAVLAQVNTMVGSACFIGSTVRIVLTFNTNAFNTGVADSVGRTTADSTMVGNTTQCIAAALIQTSARIIAHAFNTCFVLVTVEVRFACTRNRNLFTASVGSCLVTTRAHTHHTSPWHCIDNLAFSTLLAWT